MLKEDVETIKANFAAKEKECEVLRLQVSEKEEELRMMKTHLNKMIETNSKFKDDYMSFVKSFEICNIFNDLI